MHLLKKEKNFSYIEAGEGTPIIMLHGLMGGLSNFDSVTQYFSTNGYKVIIPELPIYTMSLLKTNVKSFAKYLHDFIEFKELGQCYFTREFAWWTHWAYTIQNYIQKKLKL